MSQPQTNNSTYEAAIGLTVRVNANKNDIPHTTDRLDADFTIVTPGVFGFERGAVEQGYSHFEGQSALI